MIYVIKRGSFVRDRETLFRIFSYNNEIKANKKYY